MAKDLMVLLATSELARILLAFALSAGCAFGHFLGQYSYSKTLPLPRTRKQRLMRMCSVAGPTALLLAVGFAFTWFLMSIPE
jgi:hypothetical protein